MTSKADRRLWDRFRRFSLMNSPQNDPALRIPLELVLRICDLASTSLTDYGDRGRLHSRLACVNRTFSILYGRRTWRTVAMKDGTDLPELLGRLKGDKEGSDWIEGVEVEDLTPYYSRRRIEQHWAKLQKRCRNLKLVQLGSLCFAPRSYNGVHGYTLHGMAGISTLRLTSLEVNHSLTPSTLFGKKAHRVHLIPPNLRHLVLDRIQLHGIVDTSDLDSLWPPRGQSQLVSLYLAEFKMSGYTPEPGVLVAPARELIHRNSRTLQALHYSRPAGRITDLEKPFFETLHLPNLRILSLSARHFDKLVLTAVPSVTHLTLTFCNLLGKYDTPDRQSSIAHVTSLLVEALLTGAALTRLRLLELPTCSMEPGCNEEIWEELKGAAERAGVNVGFLDEATVDKDGHFRMLVRDELRERM